jgi:hypothetical protein
VPALDRRLAALLIEESLDDNSGVIENKTCFGAIEADGS